MISFFLQMLKEIMYTFTYKHCKRSSGKCAIENWCNKSPCVMSLHNGQNFFSGNEIIFAPPVVETIVGKFLVGNYSEQLVW